VAWICAAVQNVQLNEIPVLSSQLRVVDTVRNLGVVDSQLSVSAHVAAVCCGGCDQLRQLRPLGRCMTDEAIKTLTHAFISIRLNYCNVLHCGIAEGLLSRLQSVQNAAARLVTGLGRREHITPICMRQLHWLPVRKRVMVKLATLVHRSLAGFAQAYPYNEYRLMSSVRVSSLRSDNSRIYVSHLAHNGYGDRSFASAGPSLWNSLPLRLRELDISFNCFKTLLKALLF